MSRISVRPLWAAITCAMVLAASLLVVKPDSAGAAPLGLQCRTNVFLSTNQRFVREVDGPGPIELIIDNGGVLTSSTLVTQEDLLDPLLASEPGLFDDNPNPNIPEGAVSGVFIYKVNQIGLTNDGQRAIFTMSVIEAEKGENGLAKGRLNKAPRKNFIVDYPINDPDDFDTYFFQVDSAEGVAGAVNPADNKYYFGSTRTRYRDIKRWGFEYRTYHREDDGTAVISEPTRWLYPEDSPAKGGNGDYLFDKDTGTMSVLRSNGRYKAGVDATWIYTSTAAFTGTEADDFTVTDTYQTSGQNGLANGLTGTDYTSNIHGAWQASDDVTENVKVEGFLGTTDLAGCYGTR